MAKTTADLLIDRLMTGGVPTIFGFLGHGINSVFEAVRTRQAQLRCMQVWHEAADHLCHPQLCLHHGPPGRMPGHREPRRVSTCSTMRRQIAGERDMELPRTTELPRVARIRQLLPRDSLNDIEGTVRSGLQALHLGPRIGKGKRVGITAGSRGMGGLQAVMGAILAEIKAEGGQALSESGHGRPGGAPPEDRAAVVALSGTHQKSMGVPIEHLSSRRSS